jgi:HEPN domain-containing protein
MNNLFTSGDYVWALFLGHLVIEKLLKAIAVKNGIEIIPKIHDLNKLSKISNLNSSEEKGDLLDIITSFNIEARYPDYKKEFYKKCTQEFTSFYKEKINELRLWLLDQLNK